MKILPDLHIFYGTKKQMRKCRGEIVYGFIDHGDSIDYHESYSILLNPNLTLEEIIDVIIHELEHYDLSKVLRRMNIPQKGWYYDYNEKGEPEKKVSLSDYPEWIHSDPSYYPKRTTIYENGKKIYIYQFR